MLFHFFRRFPWVLMRNQRIKTRPKQSALVFYSFHSPFNFVLFMACAKNKKLLVSAMLTTAVHKPLDFAIWLPVIPYPCNVLKPRISSYLISNTLSKISSSLYSYIAPWYSNSPKCEILAYPAPCNIRKAYPAQGRPFCV